MHPATTNPPMKRSLRVDNLRALLMVLVVFGHCLELTKSPLLYRVIYSFHIPAFIFLTGFCMKGGRKKIASTACIYVAFQLLYTVFAAGILGDGTALPNLLVKPYWILWYTMTTLWYMLLYPLLPRENVLSMLGLILSSVIAALACGFVDSVGYTLSLSRTLCYLPFFLGGVLCASHAPLRACITQGMPKRRTVIAVSGTLSALSVLFLALRTDIRRRLFYGSYAYAAEQYGPDVRLIIMLIAVVWLVLLLAAIPDRCIPFLTALGRRTYPVYLLHGFILRLLKKFSFFRFPHAVNLALCVLVTACILAAFSSPLFSRKSSKARP